MTKLLPIVYSGLLLLGSQSAQFINSLWHQVMGPLFQVLPYLSAHAFVLRKSAHFVVYAGLALVIYISLQDVRLPRTATTLGLVLIIASIDEYLQTFTPGRYGRVDDVLIDMLGAVTMLVIIQLMHGTRQRVAHKD